MTRQYLKCYLYSVDHINIIFPWFCTELITSNIILREVILVREALFMEKISKVYAEKLLLL